MAADEETPFEVLLQFSKFLEAPANVKTAKSSLVLCIQNPELAEDIIERSVDSVQQDPKNRRPILQFMATLYEHPEAKSFRPIIERRYRDLVDIGLRGTSPSVVRNAAKGLKTLLQAFDDTFQGECGDLNASINEAIGLYIVVAFLIVSRTEAEQKFNQNKQSVLEAIEREPLRVSCWSRPEDETPEEEFLSFYKKSAGLSDSDFRQAKNNLALFCQVNGLEKTEHPVVVVNLDEVMPFIPELRDSRDSKVRHTAEDFYSVVKEIAHFCFFYSDLRDFEQPHTEYYCEDDDGRKLNDYDFQSDELALFIKDSSIPYTHKFYRERAYRNRLAAYRYDHNREIVNIIPRELERDCNRCRQDCDHLFGKVFSKMKHSLTTLRSLGVEMCFLTKVHLSLALAINVALDINTVVPSQSLYSTSKYDVDWGFSAIRQKYGDGRKYIIAGRSKASSRCAEKVGKASLDLNNLVWLEVFGGATPRRLWQASPGVEDG
ncbi:hypothetical protein PSACC_03661 [Paramicrosporidium saccamoebae]|uniref:Uncharacterized protein n=1 Tax=Paramicrosporidium saccamoebae TaxID=1246581 RepID=A0A2H9TFB9_9FUNG|nr:hypothetical protein PSACC_03661 [Paramicrosporidium saccamoebae]